MFNESLDVKDKEDNIYKGNEMLPCQAKCKYCDSYESLYKVILRDGMKWLTISPGYNDEEPRQYIDRWRDELSYIKKFTRNFLLVFEVTNAGRIHIHGVYSCKDKVKEYIFLNKVRLGIGNPLTHPKDFCRPNQVRCYKGQPKEGIHYLFKDIEELKELKVMIDDIIFTRLEDKVISEYDYN